MAIVLELLLEYGTEWDRVSERVSVRMRDMFALGWSNRKHNVFLTIVRINLQLIIISSAEESRGNSLQI